MTKTHITSAVILCAALVLFCVHAFAADSQFSFTRSTTEGPAVAFAQDQVMLVPLSAADEAEAEEAARSDGIQRLHDLIAGSARIGKRVAPGHNALMHIGHELAREKQQRARAAHADEQVRKLDAADKHHHLSLIHI